jgi:hypothetical protein
VVAAGPRIHPRLLDLIERLDDGTLPIAEICRRVGAEAEARGLVRPSYERIRTLVHLARLSRPALGPSALRIVWEGGGGMRGYADAIDQLWRPRDERRPLGS